MTKTADLDSTKRLDRITVGFFVGSCIGTIFGLFAWALFATLILSDRSLVTQLLVHDPELVRLSNAWFVEVSFAILYAGYGGLLGAFLGLVRNRFPFHNVVANNLFIYSVGWLVLSVVGASVGPYDGNLLLPSFGFLRMIFKPYMQGAIGLTLSLLWGLIVGYDVSKLPQGSISHLITNFARAYGLALAAVVFGIGLVAAGSLWIIWVYNFESVTHGLGAAYGLRFGFALIMAGAVILLAVRYRAIP